MAGVYDETDGDVVRSSFLYERIVFREKTAHQLVECFESSVFGKMLFIDGEGQSSAFDERVYHEAMVHPAMYDVRTPRPNVLIFGGGEGATAREALKWPCNVTMVEWDERLVELCREHTLHVTGDVWNHPNLEVVYADCRQWVENHPEPVWDVILIDLPDAFSWDEAFMAGVGRLRRSASSVVTVQCGPLDMIRAPLLRRFQGALSLLGRTRFYGTHVPFFQGRWGWLTTARSELPEQYHRSETIVSDDDWRGLFHVPSYFNLGPN